MKHHDEFFLLQAINIAKLGIGKTSLNPSVGCIIVQKNDNYHIVSSARTANGGRPHAEYIAIEKAGNNAKGATLYCSLEPCCHYGQTPPCVNKIYTSGITRVVIGTLDPDIRVSGNGIKFLKSQGLEVMLASGSLKYQAEDVISGFTSRVIQNTPYITLKLAMSIDGKIALQNGISKWITSIEQRKKSHELRSKNDCILVGIGTVIDDDPMLNCRVSELSRNELTDNILNNNNYEINLNLNRDTDTSYYDHPITRVVLDTHLRIPYSSKICLTANQYRTIIFCCKNFPRSQEEEKSFIQRILYLESIGLHIEHCPVVKQRVIETVKKQEAIQTKYSLDLKYIVNSLAYKYKINNLLVEGGAKVATSFLQVSLINKIILFQAPVILGNDSIAGIGNLNIIKLNNAIPIDEIY